MHVYTPHRTDLNGITDEEQYTMEKKNDLEYVYRVSYYTESEDNNNLYLLLLLLLCLF